MDFENAFTGLVRPDRMHRTVARPLWPFVAAEMPRSPKPVAGFGVSGALKPHAHDHFTSLGLVRPPARLHVGNIRTALFTTWIVWPRKKRAEPSSWGIRRHRCRRAIRE